MLQRPPLFVYAAASGLEPTYSEFVKVMGGQPLDMFDPDEDWSSQFAGRRAIIDLGGWGRREHTSAAVNAKVELWHVLGYGLDHLDLNYLLENGVTVAHTPGSSSGTALAEHAMLLLLGCARHIKEQFANVAAGVLYEPWTSELAGRRLLLLGVGASGRELAARATAFDVEVTGIDSHIGQEDTYRAVGIKAMSPPDALLELLGAVDVVSLHLPLNKSTYHIIDGAALARIKPGAIVLNVARGALVDEVALLEALNDGRVAAAGIDVFEGEPGETTARLLAHPGVVATPHTAGATFETLQRRSRVVVENLARLERGETIQHTVSADDEWLVGGTAP